MKFFVVYTVEVEAEDNIDAEQKAYECIRGNSFFDAPEPVWLDVHPPEVIVEVDEGGSTSVQQSPEFVTVTILSKDVEGYNEVRRWVEDVIDGIRSGLLDVQEAAEDVTSLILVNYVVDEDPLDLLVKRLGGVPYVAEGALEYFADRLTDELFGSYIV